MYVELCDGAVQRDVRGEGFTEHKSTVCQARDEAEEQGGEVSQLQRGLRPVIRTEVTSSSYLCDHQEVSRCCNRGESEG